MNSPASSNPDIPPLSLNQVSYDRDLPTENILKANRNPPPHLRKQVFQELERRKVIAASHQDYEEAARIVRAQQKLKRSSNSKTPKTPPPSHYGTSSADDLKKKIYSLTLDYDQKIAKLKRSRDKATLEIQQKQEEDIQKFSEAWSSPKNLSEFSKPSPQLLQLRDIEHRKVLLNDFEGASQTKKLADKLEKQEKEAAQVRAINSMKADYKNMLERHQKEREANQILTNTQLVHLEAMKEDVLRPLQIALKRAQSIEERTPPEYQEQVKSSRRIRSTSDSPKFSQRSSSRNINNINNINNIDIDDDDLEIATPRTQKRAQEMRTERKIKALDLDGIDVSRYFSNNRSNSPKSSSPKSSSPNSSSPKSQSPKKTPRQSQSAVNSSRRKNYQ